MTTPPVAFPTLSLLVTDALAPAVRQIPVYAEEHFLLGGLSLRLCVIGASSLVVAGWGEPALAEWIACTHGLEVGRALTRTELLEEYGALSSVCLQRRSWRYTGRIWAGRAGEVPPSDPLPYVVEHRFPAPEGRGLEHATCPMTRVEAGWDQDRLLIRTRHDYPETPCIVWSVSYWELR
ncbi:MAG: DUF2617 family protein [Armatimonadetes bacterium]|nr:DUF2617 family protein [Armatimonadota bacterium]